MSETVQLIHNFLLTVGRLQTPAAPIVREDNRPAPRSPYLALAPKPGCDPDRMAEDRDAEQGTRHGMR